MKAFVFTCLLAVAAAGPAVVRTRAQIESYKSALEKSTEDDGLTLEQRMEKNPKANAWENSGKFEGDIVLDDATIQGLVGNYASGRMAFIHPNTKWPENTAVYEFGAGEFNLEQQRFILNVMNSLAERTCVRFRHRNNQDSNFVRITGQPNGCYARVGYGSHVGVHALNLARATPGQGCLNPVIIAHEWYHSLGFFHMQSTYNRDNYVRIHWENIAHGMAHNFDMYDNTIVGNLGLPYEYGSAMHYGTHGFSSNGRPTLSTTQPYNGVLGQTSQVTGTDIWRLARHYNCPGAWGRTMARKAASTVVLAREDGTLYDETVEPAEELKFDEE